MTDRSPSLEEQLQWQRRLEHERLTQKMGLRDSGRFAGPGAAADQSMSEANDEGENEETTNNEDEASADENAEEQNEGQDEQTPPSNPAAIARDVARAKGYLNFRIKQIWGSFGKAWGLLIPILSVAVLGHKLWCDMRIVSIHAAEKRSKAAKGKGGLPKPPMPSAGGPPSPFVEIIWKKLGAFLGIEFGAALIAALLSWAILLMLIDILLVLCLCSANPLTCAFGSTSDIF